MDEEEIEMLPKKYRKSRSARAGLTFPVGRIARILKEGKYAPRIGYGAPVYQAAILEYLAREVIELAGNAAVENGRRRISPRHIQLAVRSDTELSKLMGHVIFSSSVPSVQLQPLRKKAPASSRTKTAASSGKKVEASPSTAKAASLYTEKVGSWGAKKPPSSRRKKDDKK